MGGRISPRPCGARAAAIRPAPSGAALRWAAARARARERRLIASAPISACGASARRRQASWRRRDRARRGQPSAPLRSKTGAPPAVSGPTRRAIALRLSRERKRASAGASLRASMRPPGSSAARLSADEIGARRRARGGRRAGGKIAAEQGSGRSAGSARSNLAGLPSTRARAFAPGSAVSACPARRRAPSPLTSARRGRSWPAPGREPATGLSDAAVDAERVAAARASPPRRGSRAVGNGSKELAIASVMLDRDSPDCARRIGER